MKYLDEIGFYTLTDERAKNTSNKSNMKRCELIITGKCNFKCPYCRGLRKDIKQEMSLDEVKKTIDIWAKDNLENIRFSGGEPTVHKDLIQMVEYAKLKNINMIAVSTNGSMPLEYYKKLIKAGVNDFSISLDACCSSAGDTMSGGIIGAWDTVVNNIRELSKLTYVTVGMVFTPDNVEDSLNTIRFAHSLGVDDIRIISAAQYNKALTGLDELEPEILAAHPILNYRVKHFREGINVRGIKKGDSHQCSLIYDDSVVAGNKHFPCVIYMREGGNPIGEVNENMREDRIKWLKEHNTFKDPICKRSCLDVCICYNNKVREFKK